MSISFSLIIIIISIIIITIIKALPLKTSPRLGSACSPRRQLGDPGASFLLGGGDDDDELSILSSMQQLN